MWKVGDRVKRTLHVGDQVITRRGKITEVYSNRPDYMGQSSPMYAILWDEEKVSDRGFLGAGLEVDNTPSSCVEDMKVEIEREVPKIPVVHGEMRDSEGEPMHVFSSGVRRSEKKPPYHLVPREGIERTAKRFAFGALKYGENNWQKCLVSESAAAEFCQDAYNHLYEHATKMAAGLEPEDDHLGAIGWAQSVLCLVESRFNKKWTELVK